MAWVTSHLWGIVGGLAGTVLLPLIWRVGIKKAAQFAGAKFVQLVEVLLESGDDDWDKITRQIVSKIEREIPDGLTVDHPKVQAFAGKICSSKIFTKYLGGCDKNVAKLVVALFQTLDKRAKKLAE